MFGNYLQIRAAQARAVETDEEQSELVHEPSNVGRKLVLGVLGLGAVVAVGVTATSSSTSQMDVATAVAGEEAAPDGRFLQSEDLLDTIAQHAVRFQQEIGGEVAEGDHEELKGHARRSIAEMAAKVSTADVDSGRLLKDLQLNDEQWHQSKQILEALHDKKVQDIGNFVQNAVRGSGSLDEASAKVAEREEEFRALRDRFVPPSAQDVVNSPAGGNHWSMSMHRGALEMSAGANGWSGSLAVGGEETARRLAENVTDDRRLMTKQQMVYLLVTAIVVGVLGIVLTILTAALGAHAATVLFLVGAGLDGLLCTGSIGLTFIPGFKNFNTWIPCVILSSFTGLEAIWTFRKPRCSHTCPKGGKIVDKSCFLLVTGNYNKAAADTVCAGKGARLASINSQKDLNAVTTLTAASDAWTAATRSCPPLPSPAPSPLVACGTAWGWTDGSAWFVPSGSTSLTNKLNAAGGLTGYVSAYVKAGTSVYTGDLDTAAHNAMCEIWMC